MKIKTDAFGALLLQHIGATISNAVASFFYVFTGAYGSLAPAHTHRKRDYQKLNRASRSFAFISDVTMSLLGGKLKFKESISARLGDLLAWMYLGSTALKRFYDDGEPTTDIPFIQWAHNYTMGSFWITMENLLNNYPNRWLGAFLRLIIMPFGKPVHLPSDKLLKTVSGLLSTPNEARSRLIQGLYLADHPGNPLAKIEKTLIACIQTEEYRKRIAEATKEGTLETSLSFKEMLAKALQLNLLDEKEAQALKHYETLRKDFIAVDDFSLEELKSN